METIYSSPLEALEAGQKFYTLTTPCRQGHLAPRYAKMKRCTECHTPSWKRYRDQRKGYFSSEAVAGRKDRYVLSLIKARLSRVKGGAAVRGIAFDLKPEDIHIPEYCPLLGTKLLLTTTKGSPQKDLVWSIDRIDSSKGYAADNVWVISLRANKLKNNATLSELERIVKGLQAQVLVPVA